MDFWGVNGQQMHLLTTPFTTTFHGQITREESIADLWPIYIRDQGFCKIMEQILPKLWEMDGQLVSLSVEAGGGGGSADVI